MGLVIEGAQLLIISGIRQGVSVLVRSSGAALGVALLPSLRRVAEKGISRTERWMIAFLAIPYTLLLAALNGWFSARWQSLAEVMPNIHSRMFLPFYYHYFTTETNALHSLLANLGIYGVLGLGYRLCSQGHENTTALRPALVGAGLALLMEAGKLFVPGKHPDPTDVLLAALGAAVAFGLTAWVLHNLSGKIEAAGSDAGLRTSKVGVRPAGLSCPVSRPVLSVAMLAAAAIFLAYFPVASGWLASGLAVYALLLWRAPLLWLFAVPALLPILDLAGWSGWFFFDEFDLLLLVTFAVLLVRADRRLILPPLPRAAKWLIGLFTLSYAVSLLRGLLPLAPVDTNAFANYYSPYNALRLGKSWLWVLAFLPFLRRALSMGGSLTPEGNLKNYLLPGLLVGLAGTIVFGLWERWLFPGLGDVAAAYRVTAFFSSMHVGGCSIDIYLALAVPVVAACFLVWRGLAIYTAGLLLFAGSIYLVLVTFSRGTYLAIPVASLVLLAGAMSERNWRMSISKAFLPLILTTILLGLPILLGPYAQERFSTLSRDIQTRISLWREALEFRDDTISTSLFGMGIGSFPRVYLWVGPSRPATFRYVTEGSTFLRLGSGTPLYMLQRIQLSGKGEYNISARLRSNSVDARLRVLVCEKSLLYSYACKSHDWTVAAPDWKDYGVLLDLSQFADNLRPVWLSFSNVSHNAAIDVDDLRLEGPDGHQVLSNGDFERGHDRWFFTSEDHIAWHTKNLWVHILFEQGWVGMFLFAALTAYALVHLTRRARARDSIALVLLAPLVATLGISPVYTTLDTPRIALLWYWLLVIAAIYSILPAHSRVDSRSAYSVRA